MKLLAICLLISLTIPAHAQNLCAGKIPVSLETTLLNAHQAFRLPLSSDSPADAIDWNIKHGGSGCLSVATADFDGDGTKDYVVVLTALIGSGGLVVAALARQDSWEQFTLSDWPDGRIRIYVSTAKAGRYKRTEALDGPLEANEVDPLICPHAVAIFGGIESSGVAHCFDRNGWKHVWISD